MIASTLYWSVIVSISERRRFGLRKTRIPREPPSVLENEIVHNETVAIVLNSFFANDAADGSGSTNHHNQP